LKGARIAVVTVDVTQATAQLSKSIRVEAAIILDAVPSALLELIERPAGFGNADYWNIEIIALGHCLERGKYFLISEIPRSAEKH